MIKIKTYYIKQGKSKLFKKIDLYENYCEILRTLDSQYKMNSIVNQIIKNDIKFALLSKDLYQNTEFLNELEKCNIKVFNGKWLYKYIIPEIIDYICKKSKFDNDIEIALLTNDLTDEFIGNMEELSKKFKKIKIITEHPEKFRKADSRILEDSGYSMIISQNKKKALTKAQIIINFDFSSEIINQYNINENAVIINLSDYIKINKKRFNGIIITDYEIVCTRKADIQDCSTNSNKTHIDFYNKHIIESRVYEKALTEKKLEEASLSKFNIVRRIIKEEEILIKDLYGKNGYAL